MTGPRCSSGRFDCPGEPLTNADVRVGERLDVMHSIERPHLPTVVEVHADGVTVESDRHGRYRVDVSGSCSCIVHPQAGDQ